MIENDRTKNIIGKVNVFVGNSLIRLELTLSLTLSNCKRLIKTATKLTYAITFVKYIPKIITINQSKSISISFIGISK